MMIVLFDSEAYEPYFEVYESYPIFTKQEKDYSLLMMQVDGDAKAVDQLGNVTAWDIQGLQRLGSSNGEFTKTCTIPPRKVMQSIKGPFEVGFLKRTNGTYRKMVCSIPPVPKKDGKPLKFSPTQKGLISVMDWEKREPRFVPLDRVIWIKGEKTYLYL